MSLQLRNKTCLRYITVAKTILELTTILVGIDKVFQLLCSTRQRDNTTRSDRNTNPIALFRVAPLDVSRRAKTAIVENYYFYNDVDCRSMRNLR